MYLLVFVIEFLVRPTGTFEHSKMEKKLLLHNHNNVNIELHTSEDCGCVSWVRSTSFTSVSMPVEPDLRERLKIPSLTGTCPEKLYQTLKNKQFHLIHFTASTHVCRAFGVYCFLMMVSFFIICLRCWYRINSLLLFTFDTSTIGYTCVWS